MIRIGRMNPKCACTRSRCRRHRAEGFACPSRSSHASGYCRTCRERPARRGRHELTAFQRREVLRLARAGNRLDVLARVYGRTVAQIAHVVSGATGPMPKERRRSGAADCLLPERIEVQEDAR